MADEITQQDRYRGALLGLACGDAVGTTLEFKPPGSFAPISDMVGGGPFELEPGQWTDDTSMALCLAVSLVEQGGFDPADQMQRYVRWYREGYLSSNGVCFDIGNTVSAALRRFERSGEPYSGATDPYSAGNGSIMRLAPLPLAFAATPARAIALAAQSSRTTHGAPAALDGCHVELAVIQRVGEARVALVDEIAHSREQGCLASRHVADNIADAPLGVDARLARFVAGEKQQGPLQLLAGADQLFVQLLSIREVSHRLSREPVGRIRSPAA